MPKKKVTFSLLSFRHYFNTAHAFMDQINHSHDIIFALVSYNGVMCVLSHIFMTYLKNVAKILLQIT